MCPRVGHFYLPLDPDPGPLYRCTRCDTLLRPRAGAHADRYGHMARLASGWQLVAPEPWWVGSRMQIAQCECGLQFSNPGAYMWHWKLANELEGAGQ